MHGHQYKPSAKTIQIHSSLFCPGLRQPVAHTHLREGSDFWIIWIIISHAMSSIKYISFNSLNFPAHVHIRHPKKIIPKDMNDIFYHITSATSPWNPFIHFLHTLHSIPSPDIVTGWHMLCLIYFLCNTSLNQTRTEIPTLLMSLHQALLPSPPQRVHQALSLARGPGTLPPSPLWAPDTYVLKALWVNDPLSSPPTAFLDHMLCGQGNESAFPSDVAENKLVKYDHYETRSANK